MTNSNPFRTEELIGYLEDATQAVPGTILPTTRLDQLGGWDSIGLMELIVRIQQRTGLLLRTDDLLDVATPHDLAVLIADRAR